MGQKLIIAPSARSDLHDIMQEIARDAPDRAVKFGDALVASTNSPDNHRVDFETLLFPPARSRAYGRNANLPSLPGFLCFLWPPLPSGSALVEV